jgi:CRP-like cAMP-binding protein
VAAQVAEQRKVYRPPAGKRGAYLERNVLSAGEWVLLSAGSTTRTLRDGEVLIAEGAPFAGLFVVLDGALEVERDVGGRWLSLGTCAPARWWASWRFCRATRRAAAWRAAAPACACAGSATRR